MQQNTRGKSQKRKLSSLLVPLVTAIVSAVVWTVAIINIQRSDLDSRRAHAHSLLTTVGDTMQMVLKDYFAITHFWAEYIGRKGLPPVDDFYVLNDALNPNDDCLVFVSLAPAGIVSLNYPKGGHNILGTNLFVEPLRAPDAAWSRLAMQTMLTGPISTNYSGMVFEISTPVYTTGADGQREFWGFALAAIKAKPFFAVSKLSMLSENALDYQLKRIDSRLGKLLMVHCSSPRVFQHAVSYTFPLQNTAWTLLAEPSKGWTREVMHILTILVAITFTLLISFAASSFWRLITDERTFKRMSYIDSLTSLANSRKFYEDLEALQKKMSPYALLYLDLNDFKPVNDTYGHNAGDQLLSVVALKLLRCVRGGTGVYRVGGDEFTIVIPNEISVSALESLCLRIKTSLSQKIILDSAAVFVGTSIGYARCPEDGFRYEEIIQKAEAIMYADKKQQHAKR